MKLRFAVLAATVAAAGLDVAAKPVIWWASYPVKPGEHVLVSGGGWTENVQVKVKGGDEARTLSPTTVSETGVTFLWPKDLDAKMLSVALADETGESRSIVLNAPTAWWMQGDDFDASTPGGELRIFGRSLKGAEVRIAGPNGKGPALEKIADDDYSLTVKLPSSLVPGDYKVSLRASAFTSDSLPWRIKAAENFWTTNVFRVVDFGAVPDDGLDDDRAVHAAIAAAAKAGGGTVLFPRGRIEVHSKLVLSPHTRLKGVSRDQSGIYWQDFFNPPDILITGKHSFGIEDLYLTSGLCKQGIRPDLIPTHDFYLKRLRIRFLTDSWRDGSDTRDYSDFLRRYNTPGPAIHVYRGSRIWIEGVDVYSDKNNTGEWPVGPRMDINASDVVIRNCSNRGTGFCRLGIRRALVENNRFDTTTVSIIPGTRELFWSRNWICDRYAGDREAITQDLRQNAYGNFHPTGTVEGVKVKIDLPEGAYYTYMGGTNPAWNRLSDWDDANLQIVAGRGYGQVRRIVRTVSKTEYVIDRPFELEPDATSRFSVRFVREHLHYVDNIMRDAHVAIQLYGGGSDCIIARNRSLFAGGFIGHGIDGKGGTMPCIDCQFLDNRILSPLESFRAYATPSLIGHPGKAAWKYPKQHARGFVLRGNDITGGALTVGCPDCIVEGNAVRHSPFGLLEPGYAESHVIGANVFEDVRKERAGSWPQPSPNRFEEKLKWKSGTDPETGHATLEAAFQATGDEAVALRYWCDDSKATATFDGIVVQHPAMDRRQRKTYLFAPGRHVIRVVFSGDAQASKNFKFHLELLGDDDARRLRYE